MRRLLLASLVLFSLLARAVPAEAAPSPPRARSAERIAAIANARSAPRIAFGGIIVLAAFCLVIRRRATP